MTKQNTDKFEQEQIDLAESFKQSLQNKSERGPNDLEYQIEYLTNQNEYLKKSNKKLIKNPCRNKWEQMSSKRSFGRQNVARRTPASTQGAPNGASWGAQKVGNFLFCQNPSPKASRPFLGVSWIPQRKHFVVLLVPKATPKSLKNQIKHNP